ncbi:hypothetical protein [Pelomonas sp. BJYL3]|uniref:hypothetical protein n=1 Tax=Pelomonas sp. BJYL3 TaxID=2976697 RepID=UPI0022B377E8|nr:hypothetical protein [Pelomonas sp. BJYL3]
MDLKERLEFLMSECNWGRADLKAASGETSSVVSQWLGHGSKIIKNITKLEAAVGIADKSGFNALWIARGIGEPRTPNSSWPFKRITPAVWHALDEGLKDRIEAMVEGALAIGATGSMPPTAPAWRGMALQIAAGVDAVTQGDQFRRFVNAVDAQFSAEGPSATDSPPPPGKP